MKHADAFNDRQNGMTYSEIATKYGVSVSTVKSWASRYWSKDKVATKVATKNKRATGKRGAPPGNHNAAGHGAPMRNQNALKHGLFSKYLPAETLAIVTEIEDASTLDILWANIQLKFAAILRAQKIMNVASADDHLRYTETSSAVENNGDEQKQYVSKKETLITSMEREEKFLYAQSRAMDTLARMIKQYEDMLHVGIATEEQRMRIQKLKAEVFSLTGVDEDNVETDMREYVQALKGEATEVWTDEEE